MEVKEAEKPGRILPRAQSGRPPGSPAQPLVIGLVMPAGRISVTTTFTASSGPLLVTSRV